MYISLKLQGYGETITPIELNKGSQDALAKVYQNLTDGFYLQSEDMSHYILRKVNSNFFNIAII